MKKYLLAFSMLFLVGVSAMDATPKHRHRHRTTTVSVKADSASASVEVYSDTTSVSGSNSDSIYMSNSMSMDSDDFDDNRDPVSALNWLLNHGPGGTLAAIFVVVCVFLFLVAPFLIFAFIIYYLIKRHNDRVKLSIKAMEMGQLPATGVESPLTDSDETLWRKGVKNSAIGLGLALMFLLFDAEELAGVGLLVLCYGLGQVYMARASRKRRENKNEDNHPEF